MNENFPQFDTLSEKSQSKIDSQKQIGPWNRITFAEFNKAIRKLPVTSNNIRQKKTNYSGKVIIKKPSIVDQLDASFCPIISYPTKYRKYLLAQNSMANKTQTSLQLKQSHSKYLIRKGVTHFHQKQKKKQSEQQSIRKIVYVKGSTQNEASYQLMQKQQKKLSEDLKNKTQKIYQSFLKQLHRTKKLRKQKEDLEGQLKIYEKKTSQ